MSKVWRLAGAGIPNDGATRVDKNAALGMGYTRGAAHIVEERIGGLDEWAWRKWSDGTAEAWKLQDEWELPITDDWGALKCSALQYDTFPSGLFSSVEHCGISVAKATYDLWLAFSGSASTTRTQSFFAMRPNAATPTVAFSFHAIGRWS